MGNHFSRQKSRLLQRAGAASTRHEGGELGVCSGGPLDKGLCMCTCVWRGRSFQGMRSVCGGLRICLTWLGKRETFPSWEDQKVSLFSVALNQEELK